MVTLIPLTSDEKAIIANWHQRIQRRLFPQMTDGAWLYMRMRGGDRPALTELWIEMICRSAMHNDGRALLKPAVRVLMEKALSIPILAFRDRLNVGEWGTYESPATNWIGNTWLDVDFTMESSALALAAGEWPPVVISHEVVPDFGSIIPDDIYPWLGFKGGALETEVHNPPPARLVTKTLTAVRGTSEVMALEVEGGVPPYTLREITNFSWVYVNTSSLSILLAPVAGTALGEHTIKISIIDSRGRVYTDELVAIVKEAE